ncbi:peptidyl-prolyl cis-trans isomerase, partial [Acinetobacter baumannii]
EEIVRECLVAKEKSIAIGDDEIKKAFDENKDKLGSPEAVHLRHILVAKEDQAKALVEKIKGGADFKALALENSLAASGKAA